MDPKIIAGIFNFLKDYGLSVREIKDSLLAIADRTKRGPISFWEAIQTSLVAFEARKGLPFRSAIILLSDSISGAGSANSGEDDYRISPSEDFVVDEVFTTLVLEAQESQIATITANGTNLVPSERLLHLASNARFKLFNKDTKTPLIESDADAGLPFGACCANTGARSLRYGVGDTPTFIIPANTTLGAEFSLASAAAVFNTAATEYGVALKGAYVNRKYLGLSR